MDGPSRLFLGMRVGLSWVRELEDGEVLRRHSNPAARRKHNCGEAQCGSYAATASDVP